MSAVGRSRSSQCRASPSNTAHSRKERPASQESRRLAQGTTNTTGQEAPEDGIVSTDTNLRVACNGIAAYKATAQHRCETDAGAHFGEGPRPFRAMGRVLEPIGKA